MILLREKERRLYYDFIGGRNGHVVCFVHSIAADSGMWAEQASALIADGYGVLRIDLPGHGGSETVAGDLTSQHVVDDVLAILDVNRIERVHFVGLSIGGVVGQAFAATNGNRLRTLVLSNTVPKSSPEASAAWAGRIAAVRQAGSTSPLAEGMIERWISAAVMQNEPSKWGRTLQGILATSAEGFIGCAVLMQNFDFTASLSQIKTPTLVIAGSDDGAAPAAAGRSIAQTIPNAIYKELPNSRHLPNLEHPALYNRVLADWLTEHRT